ANKLMAAYGVATTMFALGALYLASMMIGAFSYRVPPDGWRPDGWTPPPAKPLVSTGEVSLAAATTTPRFWLIWAVLFLNVSAGIGVIGMASPMLQEIFGGDLVGKAGVGFAALDAADKAKLATLGAAFLGLISLFNIAGRFVWASLSDAIGRKTTYFAFFALGILLYVAAPNFAQMHSRPLFVAAICLILSMYGGGFATVPAYLADMFGKQFVGAIHGRLLTAWSLAGLVGPLIVGWIRQSLISAGTPDARLYDGTFYVLAALLAVGFVCNLLVRPVDPAKRMSDVELAAAQGHAKSGVAAAQSYGIGLGGLDAKAAFAWALIAIPVLWGLWQALLGAAKIFG
ncbi:MAG: MFS transporter, partial [Hyphomicrobiales bacterium]|nr:MFS transporter [Hyphomicrobiales bacterium]